MSNTPMTPAIVLEVLDAESNMLGAVTRYDLQRARAPLLARIAELEAELAKFKDNAKRYRFVETLARAHSLRMDGTSEWSIGPIGARGRTLSEAIDAVRIIVPMKESGDA